MLDTIKTFFDKHINPAASHDAVTEEHALQVASAALLLEVMRMDLQIKPEEQEAVLAAIRSKFDLSDQEAAELVSLAREEAQNAADYFEFTSRINKGFNFEQKVRLVEHLWAVAFADRHLDQYEDHLVKKIAELLYVPQRDVMLAKHKMKKQFGD